MWDDGYGTQTMRDCAKTMEMGLSKSDGGPPRWFCPVACGKPLKGSPVLLYLPGVDGTGAGLAVHEKALGKFSIYNLHENREERYVIGIVQHLRWFKIREHSNDCQNQIVVGTLMNLSDNPTKVSIGQDWRESDITNRVPVIVTGNDFSTLYAPLVRDGRMDKFYSWWPKYYPKTLFTGGWS